MKAFLLFLFCHCFYLFCHRFWAIVCKTVTLCYGTVVLSVCLSVTLVYIVATGQTVGWIKMKLGIDAGLDPFDIVLDGDPAPPEGDGDPAPPEGAQPRFSANVCCGQTAGWIKILLGREVGLAHATLC